MRAARNCWPCSALSSASPTPPLPRSGSSSWT